MRGGNNNTTAWPSAEASAWLTPWKFCQLACGWVVGPWSACACPKAVEKRTVRCLVAQPSDSCEGREPNALRTCSCPVSAASGGEEGGSNGIAVAACVVSLVALVVGVSFVIMYFYGTARGSVLNLRIFPRERYQQEKLEDGVPWYISQSENRKIEELEKPASLVDAESKCGQLRCNEQNDVERFSECSSSVASTALDTATTPPSTASTLFRDGWRGDFVETEGVPEQPCPSFQPSGPAPPAYDFTLPFAAPSLPRYEWPARVLVDV